MSTFVESLKRLFKAKKVTKKKLKAILDSEKITQEEFDYIIGG